MIFFEFAHFARALGIVLIIAAYKLIAVVQ